MNNNPVAFICDANDSVGFGHFIRSLTLACSLINYGREVVFIGEFSDKAKAMARYFGVVTQDAEHDLAPRLARLNPSACDVVIDSYRLRSEDIPTDRNVVLIDDYCELPEFPVAGVINFTLGASRYDYCALGARNQALGLQFFLPHPSFGKVERRCVDDVTKVLIVIGSNDPSGIVPHVISSLNALHVARAVRILGNSKKLGSMQWLEIESLPFDQHIEQHYEWADFCITSGGLAKYESAYLAKPAAVISNTAAEFRETREFAADSLCFDLGLADQIDIKELTKQLRLVLEGHEHRLRAHRRCCDAFSLGSADAAAHFALECFGRKV